MNKTKKKSAECERKKCEKLGMYKNFSKTPMKPTDVPESHKKLGNQEHRIIKFHRIITSLLIPHHSYRATRVENQNATFRLVAVDRDASSHSFHISSIVIIHIVLWPTRQLWHICLHVSGFRMRAAVPMTSTRLIAYARPTAVGAA